MVGDNLKWTPEGARRCVACERRRYEEQKARIAAARAAAGVPLPVAAPLGAVDPLPRSACGRGHALSGDNLIVRASGRRECRACRAASREARRDRRRALGREHWERELGSRVLGDRRCRRGHLLADAGIYVSPAGEWECRACKRDAAREAAREAARRRKI